MCVPLTHRLGTGRRERHFGERNQRCWLYFTTYEFEHGKKARSSSSVVVHWKYETTAHQQAQGWNMGGLHAWLHVHEPTDACRKGYESVAAAYLAPPAGRLSASCGLRCLGLEWSQVCH